MRRLTSAAVIGVALLALSGCSNDDAPVAAAGLPQREVAAGEVTVTITPTRIDAERAEFAVAFDTHSVDLDLDVAANAELTVGGTDWVDPAWDGAGPGGHHRDGTIQFTASGPASGEATLTLGGLDEPVTASWTLPREADVRGYTLDKDDYLLRLRKIEGQVRGLQRLVEGDTYCIDILTQIASVNAALQKVALGLVDQHLRQCVIDAMDAEPDVGQQRLTDATLAVQRLLQL